MTDSSPPALGACRFFLVRHGAVDASWEGRVYGDLDVALAPHGEAEARAAASRLDGVTLDAVVSSGLARAEFGAALLRAPRGLPRRDEPLLRELDRGGWRGLDPRGGADERAAAFRDWTTAPDRVRAPGGESLDDLAGRVLPCLDALAREHAGGAVAIVSHAWVLRVVVCEVLQVARRLAPRLALATGALVVVDWPGGGRGAATGGGGGRPTLAGYAVDRPPDAGRTWFRGPRR